MFATILITLSACPGTGCDISYWPGEQSRSDGRVTNYGYGYRYLYGNGYYPPAVYVPRAAFYPLPSPWNAAVAELRARQRPRQGLSASTVQTLQELEYQAAEAYDILRAADPQDKSELRREWIAARDELEQARIRAAREARRR